MADYMLPKRQRTLKVLAHTIAARAYTARARHGHAHHSLAHTSTASGTTRTAHGRPVAVSVASQELRGDDKTFVSGSRPVTIPAYGSGPIATCAHAQRKVVVAWPDTVKVRAELAAEFNLGTFTFVPCVGGVLEYGIER
jgi:hypothetical protein